MWGVLTAAGVLAVTDGRSPGPAPADAPDEEFSASRAWLHLEEIAEAPHPVGTAEHQRVRRYLVDTLGEMGFDVEVQDVAGWPRGELANVMVRIAGTDSSGAVMLATHYDSVPDGPGASDAGISVAALVETARALAAGPRPANDIIVLLTDGEEVGLVGGAAFVDHHPWASDVRLVFNFEGRGAGGPPVAFEVERPTVALLHGYVRNAPRPVSSASVVPAVPESYRRWISDFAEFRRLGIQGLHFALVGKSIYYHTPLDDLDHASRSSLQHIGETALSLARHFGDEDLSEVRNSPRATWSTAIPGGGWAAPAWIAWPLLAAAVALAGVAVDSALRRHGRRVRELVLAGGLHAASIVAAVVLGVALLRAVKLSSDARVMLEELPIQIHRNSGDLVNGPVFAWAFIAAAAAAVSALLSLGRRRLSDVSLVTSGLLLSGMGLIGTTLWDTATGAVAAAVYVLAAAGNVLWIRGSVADGYRGALVLAGFGAPLVMTGTALLWFGYLGFTLNNVALLMAGPAVMGMLLVPHLELTRRVTPWLAPLAFASIAVALVVLGVTTEMTDGDLVRFAGRCCPWSAAFGAPGGL